MSQYKNFQECSRLTSNVNHTDLKNYKDWHGLLHQPGIGWHSWWPCLLRLLLLGWHSWWPCLLRLLLRRRSWFLHGKAAGRTFHLRSHVWCVLWCSYKLLQVAHLSSSKSINKWEPECNGPTSYSHMFGEGGTLAISKLTDCKTGYAQIEVVTFCCWKDIPAAAPSVNLNETPREHSFNFSAKAATRRLEIKWLGFLTWLPIELEMRMDPVTLLLYFLYSERPTVWRRCGAWPASR